MSDLSKSKPLSILGQLLGMFFQAKQAGATDSQAVEASVISEFVGGIKPEHVAQAKTDVQAVQFALTLAQQAMPNDSRVVTAEAFMSDLAKALGV